METNLRQKTGYCVETVDLTHRFAGGETALQSVNLQVPEGAIYGFLGPNGAGKTTTLKLILGLLKKQSGEIRVFGKDFASNRVEILRKTGAMIESPSIYGHLNAAENLRVLQKVYNAPVKRIAEVLKLVDLERTGNKKTSEFSLGMKQRLALAMALLPAPQLLILDEPTNGLDPAGILEIRALLRDLSENHGMTILISSHLLPEIEKIAAHVGIISGGRLLFQGTLDELLNKRRQNSFTIFETSETARAGQIAHEQFGCAARFEDGRLMLPWLEREQIARVNQKLVENGIAVYRIGRLENDLERIFFDVIGE